MKLIKEEISDVQYLTEERDGKKSLYIVGPFLAAEVVTKMDGNIQWVYGT